METKKDLICMCEYSFFKSLYCSCEVDELKYEILNLSFRIKKNEQKEVKNGNIR